MCEQSFPRKTAFAFLADVANAFLKQHGARVDTAAKPYYFLEFGTPLLYFYGKPIGPSVNSTWPTGPMEQAID